MSDPEERLARARAKAAKAEQAYRKAVERNQTKRYFELRKIAVQKYHESLAPFYEATKAQRQAMIAARKAYLEARAPYENLIDAAKDALAEAYEAASRATR